MAGAISMPKFKPQMGKLNKWKVLFFARFLLQLFTTEMPETNRIAHVHSTALPRLTSSHTSTHTKATDDPVTLI